MNRIATWCLLLCVSISACEKKDASNPAHGEISGMISPKDAATELMITTVLNGNLFSQRTLPGTNGHFKFAKLAPGHYTLSIAPSSGYEKPADILVAIGADSIVSLGEILISKPMAYGDVSGIISPAEAVSGIVLSYTEGPALETISTLYLDVDAQTGKFIFKDIPIGNYAIRFLEAKGFMAPEDLTVQVEAGQVNSLGLITCTENPLVSSLTFKAAGSVKAWNRYAGNSSTSVSLSATYHESELTISGAHKTGSMHTIGGTNERLSIKLLNVTGPGAYLCNDTERSEMTYSQLSVNGKPGWTASTRIGGGHATVTITAIDPVEKLIIGTFFGTLKRETYDGGFLDAEIINGAFQLPYP